MSDRSPSLNRGREPKRPDVALSYRPNDPRAKSTGGSERGGSPPATKPAESNPTNAADTGSRITRRHTVVLHQLGRSDRPLPGASFSRSQSPTRHDDSVVIEVERTQRKRRRDGLPTKMRGLVYGAQNQTPVVLHQNPAAVARSVPLPESRDTSPGRASVNPNSTDGEGSV